MGIAYRMGSGLPWHSSNATMRVRASTSTAVLLLALFAVTLNRAGAYPIIAEIDEDDETVSRENV
jgi:hypothetical protein